MYWVDSGPTGRRMLSPEEVKACEYVIAVRNMEQARSRMSTRVSINGMDKRITEAWTSLWEACGKDGNALNMWVNWADMFLPFVHLGEMPPVESPDSAG